MTTSKEQSGDWEVLPNGIFREKTVTEFGMDHSVFRQGQPADSLFYVIAINQSNGSMTFDMTHRGISGFPEGLQSGRLD